VTGPFDRSMDDRGVNPKNIVARSYDLIAEQHAAWALGVRQEERLRFATLLTQAFPRGSGYDSATNRQLVDAAGLTVEALTLETADEDGEPTSFWWLVARKSVPPVGLV